MVQLTKFALKRPVTIILCLVTIVFFGFQTLMGAKVELIPEMELPMLLVSTVYAGASPDDVSELITTKQEDAIASLSDIDTVQSYSMENVSVVMIQYNYGTNLDTAYMDLKKALDGIQGDMPDDVNSPTIMELDMNSQPVVTLAVSGQVDGNLYTYIENNIVPEFEKLGTVGEVSLSGGQKSYVRVELQEEKMAQYGLTLSQVAQLVGAADFTIPAGDLDVGKRNLSVSVGNDYDDIEALKTIPIPLGGSTIHLSDIANVYEAAEDASSIGRYNGNDIISIGIKKQQSSTAIEMSEQVMQEVKQLEAENPALHFDVISDSSERISDSINDVYQTVIMAVILAMIVLYLFCGDLRASIIIGLSIVSSVVVALICVSAMGFSLNVISLTSLVFGVGMMVDNSINVMDGCFRAKEKLNYYDAAIEGAKNMVGAIAGGTATNCVVFIPLMLMQGLSGQLFKQLAYTVIFCLLASLFSATALVPLCFSFWHPQEKENAPVSRIIKGMQRWYRSHMPAIVPKTKRVFGVTAVVLLLSLVMATQLPFELMPAADEGIVEATVKVKPGLRVEEINKVVSQLEDLISSDDNLDYYLLTYGGSGLSISGGSDISLTAYLKDDRKESTDDVIDRWMEASAEFTDCTISMDSGSSTGMSSMSNGRQIEVDIQGTDYDLVKADADRLTEELRARDDVMQVHSSVENAAPILKVKIDPVKAQAEALTPASVGSMIYTNLSGVKAATIQMNNEDTDVTVEYAPDRFNSVDALENMLISTPMGTQIALSDIADVVYQDSPQQIVRKDKQYQVSITMQAKTGLDSKKVEASVNSFANSWDFQNGVGPAANAYNESMNDELMSLVNALVTAIFLIFIAMAIQFESAKYSLMIMVTIPFSMIGAFGFLWLADNSISMVSMLGFLMMVGNVVNNGILYVETANQLREEMPLEEALVEAGALRMRPILMTMTITVISELPNVFAYGESGSTMQGSALVNVGGLIASTVLMLLMMPTFYRWVTNLGKKHREELIAE